MTDAELVRYSGEHLFYELQMFWWATGVLPYLHGALHNAVLESWLLHLRNLIMFFCYGKKDADDVVAADFFDKPSEWQQAESKTLETARVRANKELSHITEMRKYTDKEKLWEFGTLSKEIETIARRFASTASKTKLHSNVVQMFHGQRVTAVLSGSSASTATIS